VLAQTTRTRRREHGRSRARRSRKRRSHGGREHGGHRGRERGIPPCRWRTERDRCSRGLSSRPPHPQNAIAPGQHIVAAPTLPEHRRVHTGHRTCHYPSHHTNGEEVLPMLPCSTERSLLDHTIHNQDRIRGCHNRRTVDQHTFTGKLTDSHETPFPATH